MKIDSGQAIAGAEAACGPQLMPDVLSSYFRCPEGCVTISGPEAVDDTEGFFEFGPGNLCYGRCEGPKAQHPASGTPQALDRVRFSESGCRLPFDLDSVVDNLRLERYQHELGQRTPTLARFYYAARPLMPNRLRRLGQRLYLSDWSKIPFPRWPVDTSVDNLLRRCLGLALQSQGIDRLPFIWFWPRGYRACGIVTHDVETEAGLSMCERLMDLDDAHNVKASFQLVPEERYEVSFRALARIKERGFEVNVQDLNHDGLLYLNRERFLERVKRINHYGEAFGASGFRAGVLYRNLDWYDALGFAYDMSVPNVGHLEAQRGGCCTVMPFFIGRILELPVTTTQDYTLFYILNSRSISMWQDQAETLMKSNGLISLILHPDYLFDDGNWQIYADLLRYLNELRSQRSLWLTTPGEVDRWWRLRSEMRLEMDQGRWTIQGPGREEAEIRYAVPCPDGIVFEQD